MRRAAERGDAEAQYLYGRLVLDGHGLAPDPEAARNWLSRAADQGHVWAQRFLHVLSLADPADRGLMLRELKRQRAAGQARLEAVAADPAYAFDASRPVRVGLGFEAEWRYLNALRGPQGETVHYRRLGPCCEFEREGTSQRGFLSRYEVWYAGLGQPVVLYLNMFEEARLQAPQGFTYATDEDNP